MKSDIFANTESAKSDAFALQNSKMLKVRVGVDGNPDTILARQGAMVAYQGQASFDYQGAGGIGKMLKQKLSGEGVATMRVSGQAVQIGFGGQGWVIVQPSELDLAAMNQSGQNTGPVSGAGGGVGGALGGLLGR